MSKAAAQYQQHITGKVATESYLIDGVKFDGIKNGVLLDAKYGYASFMNKNTRKWHKWFTGQDPLKAQAERQIKAAQGMPIEWHFENKQIRDLVAKTLSEKYKEITCIYTPLNSQ